VMLVAAVIPSSISVVVTATKKQLLLRPLCIERNFPVHARSERALRGK
jgi:hypothetical protein